jgi:chromosome segregation ATPase
MKRICPVCKNSLNVEDINICPNCLWDFTCTDTLVPYSEQKKKQTESVYNEVKGLIEKIRNLTAKINTITQSNNVGKVNINKLKKEISELENIITSNQTGYGEELIDQTTYNDLSSYENRLQEVEKEYAKLIKYKSAKEEAKKCLNEIRNNAYNREIIYKLLKTKFGSQKIGEIIRSFINT